MLENRKIVVTGADGGLGRTVCDIAEELGATTLRLDLAFSDPGDNCHAVDLTDVQATAAVLAQAGDYDGVFNIAGGFAMGTDTWEAGDGDWERMFALNVTTLRSVLKTAVPHLLQRGGGNIVNVGAYGALQGQGAMSAYCASKSVVMRLTESLAEEVRERGVNVNAVLPTVIDTPVNREAMPDVDRAQWVAPADLANVICFLGSTAARAVHGALVPVRGLS